MLIIVPLLHAFLRKCCAGAAARLSNLRVIHEARCMQYIAERTSSYFLRACLRSSDARAYLRIIDRLRNRSFCMGTYVTHAMLFVSGPDPGGAREGDDLA